MSKARTASTNKTGLVLKISIALVVLLGLLVYKLNDYFLNDKTYAMQGQIRKGVLSVKTSVSGQLSQLKNSLSGYEADFSEASVNWVQLDPFFVLAQAEKVNDQLKITKIVARSNTPAERWNSAYLEKALSINKSKENSPVLIQLFKDRANSKFILIRFLVNKNKELVLASTADYFQKYFDIERGSRNKSLLINTENILAAHTEADYIATSSVEGALSASKYVVEKEEIVGTNLISIGYVLKSKIVSGFAVPWSIVGVVIGLGFILIGIVFYSLDPLERRVERYKKQEREQIYKDTVKLATADNSASGLATSDFEHEVTVKKIISLDNPNVSQEPRESQEPATTTRTRAPIFRDVPVSEERKPFEIDEPETATQPEIINLLERATPQKTSAIKKSEVEMPTEAIKPKSDELSFVVAEDEFLTLDEEKIDLDEIEKALALDDFDNDRPSINFSADSLEKNLQPQKISLNKSGAPIEKPQFSFEKKDFKVDEIKINVRRPERS